MNPENSYDDGRKYGREDGFAKGKEKGKSDAMVTLARSKKQNGESFEKIDRYTDLDTFQMQSL